MSVAVKDSINDKIQEAIYYSESGKQLQNKIYQLKTQLNFFTLNNQ